MLRNSLLVGILLLPISTVSALKCEFYDNDFCGKSNVPESVLTMAKNQYKLGEIPFIDTGNKDWFTPSVKFLKEKKWISGYKDKKGNLTGIFDPSGSVTKAEVTKMIFLMSGAVEDKTLETLNPSAQSHWAKHWIALAENLNIALWDGTVDPNQKVTRAEVIRLIFDILKEEPKGSLSPKFIDVPTTHRYFRYIQSAQELEIISGYPDGLFRPDASISRAEVSKVIERTYKALVDKIELSVPTESLITAQQYEKYATEYTSVPFEFQMQVPGFYRFRSFKAAENEIMRFGFSTADIVEENNVMFWLKIIGAENALNVSIRKKFGGQIISDFPREGFSRSFFRIEGNVKYENVMGFLQKNIQYKKVKNEEDTKKLPIVPEVIRKNLEK